jgi:hypothetical protein
MKDLNRESNKYPKLINRRCAIKTCKHNIIATGSPSIRLTFPS